METRIQEMTREIDTLSKAHSSLAQDKVCYNHNAINLRLQFFVLHIHVIIGDAGAECLFIRKSTNSGTAQVRIELTLRAETPVYLKFFE